MPLQPENIANKEFSPSRRGYDPDEVKAFLQEIADAYQALLQAKQSPAQLDYENLADEVAAIVETARTSAESIVGKATAGAKAQLADATERSDRLLSESQQRSQHLRTSAERDARKLIEEAEASAKQMTERADQNARARSETTARETSQLQEKVLRETSEQRAAAKEEAERVRREADEYARTQRAETDQQCAELLEGALQRFESLDAHERHLKQRIALVEEALARLKHEMEKAEPPSDAVDPAAGPQPPDQVAGDGAARTPIWTKTEIEDGQPRPTPVAKEDQAAS